MWISICLLLSACAYNQSIPAPVGDREKHAIPAGGYHQVKRGESLYSIAWLYGLTANQLADWNSIRAPYTIYQDQRLRLGKPLSAAKPKPRIKSRPKRVIVKQPKKSKPAVKIVAASKPKTVAKPSVSQTYSAPARKVLAKPVAEPKMPKKVSWLWPADGKLLSRFDPKLVGRKGISIVGKSGDPVRAGAAGKVVYAGSGLSGYGRLIIIKHNQKFLSAYAHNRKLIAKEGEWVKSKQVIAHMGNSGTNQTQLYFEIRKDGAPVNPLRYLPKR
ncbi:MAG: peptidoglycan DD-metalloendopeptidase family protein [Gammaproteobacteria bacterium]